MCSFDRKIGFGEKMLSAVLLGVFRMTGMLVCFWRTLSVRLVGGGPFQ